MLRKLLKYIELKPIAEESFGVRSMSFYVETPDIGILLDPGVSLAPRRYGKPPHPRELEALKEARDRLSFYTEISEVITISHYHLDHYTPPFKSIYEGTEKDTFKQIYKNKLILAKDPENSINYHQKVRAHLLLKKIKDLVYDIKFVDSNTVKIGDTIIKFSRPVPHGPIGTKLGFVLMTTISYFSDRVLYAPDIQGPMSEETMKYILNEKPKVAIIGGPPTYLRGIRVSEDDIEKGMINLVTIAKNLPLVIVCHHLLRDPKWEEEIKRISNKVSYTTASRIIGKRENLLEVKRKELYEKEPPDNEYLKLFKRTNT